MSRLALLSAAAAIGLVAVNGAASAPKSIALCVGGPQCFATIDAALTAAPDGGTIQIHHGTYAGGIAITRDVSLVGAGKAVISGGGPVVTIGSTTSTPTVTLRNLTVTGGVTTSNPQAPNCGPDNSCGPGYADATALGGGIEAFPGTTVTLSHVVVTGNVSSPALTTQSVKAVCPGNVPCSASFGDGAGIDVWGTMTLDHSTVSDNHASAVQSNGGGITVEADASLSLRNSTVSGNTAGAAAPTGRFSSGGGIFVESGGTLAVENSSVSGNGSSTAHSFPDGFPMQDGPDASNSIGGGIFVNGGGSATIRNSHIDRNTITVDVPNSQSAGFDAGLCAFGQASLANSTVNGNSVTVHVLSTADSGPSGPSALEFDDVASVQNSRIDDNTITVTSSDGDAGAIGALGFFEGSSVTVANTRISGNTATATTTTGAAMVWGGGIFDNGPLLLQNDRISGNSAAADGLSGFAQGGGISNGAFSDPGGSPLALQNTRVENNTLSGTAGVTLQGGGLYTVGFPVTLTNSRIEHNTPDDCEGC